jgi:hypothetical protein
MKIHDTIAVRHAHPFSLGEINGERCRFYNVKHHEADDVPSQEFKIGDSVIWGNGSFIHTVLAIDGNTAWVKCTETDPACRTVIPISELQCAPSKGAAIWGAPSVDQWFYRPHATDDWGAVRDIAGRLVARALTFNYMEEDELKGYRRNKTDPAEEDARLIASAPAMHDALDRIFSFISYINIHGVGEQLEVIPGLPQPVLCHPDEFWRIFQDIGKLAAAALAKGESPTSRGSVS